MSLGNRNSQHSFAQIPAVHHPRSSFDRSHTAKDMIGCDMLYPILVDEIIPGDTMSLQTNAFARLATQLVPIMDNMYLDFFFFFVPNRLVWTNWEKFNGAQTDPGDSTDFVIPTIPYIYTGGTTPTLVESIWTHLGLPPGVASPGVDISALPLRAYNLIWNNWFRDENLQDSLTVSTDDGPDAMNEYVLMPRGKRHDYFTSCLPWPQKGTAVDLPLGTSAPVVAVSTPPDNPWVGNKVTTGTPVTSGNVQLTTAGAVWNGTDYLYFNPNGGLEADLSSATAATINQLREAMQVQSLLELDARGGTRYTEILLAHFGVISPDFRLQRPEYLGGGSIRVNTHIVPQMSSTSGSNYQGNLAAFATASTMDKHIGFSKSFVEHGYVIGLCAARADITYQKGINRMWTRSTRYDFFWPKLQQIGEQAVLRREIYATGTVVDDETVFGYQERYGEYRYKPSEIRGMFNGHFTSALDQWHLAEEFSSAPSLNSTFIASNTPIARVVNLYGNATPPIYLDLFFSIRHARPMMTYSVPATFGRF